MHYCDFLRKHRGIQVLYGSVYEVTARANKTKGIHHSLKAVW